ncbi:putative transcription factor interactor and regulator Znf-B family [Helianthus debilis subsp. tardiflorus]
MENSNEVNSSRDTIKATKANNATDANLNINGVNLQAVIDVAVLVHTSNVKDEQGRGITPRNRRKRANYGLNKNYHKFSKKPVCKTCYKRHQGQCQIEQRPKQCGICKGTGHQSHEYRDIKNAVCCDYSE